MCVTVLIIDDEPAVIEIAQAFLVQAGYNALTARRGHKGLDAWLAYNSIIDLVIVDMEMPDIDGSTIIKEILKIKPDGKIIAISGNPETRKNCQAQHFLAKPFNYEKFTATIDLLMQ